jgi:lipopolysaccharide transport system permease protein
MPTSPAAAVANPAPGHPPQERIIEAGRRDNLYLLELWHYRELFYFLAWRDILVRYKQTAAGIAWVLIKAMVTLLVLTVVFGRVAQLPSDGVPYSLLVFAAMLPWQFFAGALTDCSNSLVSNGDLISKIYFPRLIVPGSAMIVSLVDLAISCVVLALLLTRGTDRTRLAHPALPLLVVAAALRSEPAWFAALTAEYRDFRFIAGFVVQLGLYISPVGFSSSVVPEHWRLLYSLNPLVGVIDGSLRWAILRGTPDFYWPGLA